LLRARPFDRLILGGPVDVDTMLRDELPRPLRARFAGISMRVEGTMSTGVRQIAPIILLVVALCCGAVAACTAMQSNGSGAVAPSGIHKIQHVVIIMQENRSFDNYFGTYPGADNIPMKNDGARAR
jgi:phospholipase C